MPDQIITPQSMLEVQPEPQPAPVEPAPEPQPQQPPQSQPSDGTDWVDMSNFTPDQKKRWDRIYWNMKEYEKDNVSLRAHITQLTQAVNAITEQNAVQNETVQRNQIMQRMLVAREQGNHQLEIQLQGELSNLGQRVQRPVPIPAPPPPTAATGDELFIRQWSQEVNTDGNFRRPWALEGHPKYQQAFDTVAELVRDPRFSGNTEAILAETDRRMGLAPQQRAPGGSAVMASSSQVRPQMDGEITLTAEQLHAARKFGITPKEYAAQLTLMNRHGGAYQVTGKKS